MEWRYQFASLIRRVPLLMRVPYYAYRLIQPKYSMGAVGVVVNEHHHILLVEHVFHPKMPWGLPGGWIGRNEDPALTAEREIMEELGMQVTVTHLLSAERTAYQHMDFAYLCRSQGDVSKLSYELLQYKWFSYDTLPRLHKFHYDAIQAAFAVLKSEDL